MAEVLAFISPNLFRYKFLIVFASYKKLVLKIVGGLHYFGSEIIKKSAINKHYIFYCNNSFSFLFGKPVFFVHI